MRKRYRKAATLLAVALLVTFAGLAEALDCSGIAAWNSSTTYALGAKVTRVFVSGSGNPGVANNAGTVGATYAYKNTNGGRWGDDPAVGTNWSVWGALMADGNTIAGNGQAASACSGGATPTNTATSTATATTGATATHTATATATPTATSSGGGCPAFQYCTAYALNTVVTYNGQNYKAVGAISATRDCSAYTPATDNWWQQGGTCGGSTPTSTATSTPTPTPTTAPGGGISQIVTSAIFDQLYPPANRNPLYSYNDFKTMVDTYYPSICNTGSTNDRKRECAAFFANSSQEVGSGRLVRECYCQPAGVAECEYYNGVGVAGPGYTSAACDYNNATWYEQSCGLGAAGQRYWGRGPLQLSWNPNYCAAQIGTGGGTELFNNPNSLFTNTVRMWRVAGWYWTTSTGVVVTNSLGAWPEVTMHTAITRTDCVPGGLCGFADTIRAINGAIECQNGPPPQQHNRVVYYNGSGNENDEDNVGGTLGILGYTGGLFGRRHCAQ